MAAKRGKPACSCPIPVWGVMVPGKPETIGWMKSRAAASAYVKAVNESAGRKVFALVRRTKPQVR